MLDRIANVGVRAVEGYFRLLSLASLTTTAVDEAMIALAGQGPIPPMHLRMRVHGMPDLQSFLQTGFRCASDLEAALEKIGRKFADFSQILDFGCGSGRTLRWLPKFAPDAKLYGTDIDATAIEWLANHTDFARVSSNPQRGALAYPDNTFDLVYAISVFTHMDETHQFFWLEELRRVMQPGGILLASLHGYERWKDFAPEALAELQEKGVHVARTRMWDGVFPDWYQNTYHTVAYVRQAFGAYFEIVDYLPLALDNNHDLVVLRKTEIA
jgi:SAM-dependent methyltransferase